jgi:hypothetical protein
MHKYGFYSEPETTCFTVGKAECKQKLHALLKQYPHAIISTSEEMLRVLGVFEVPEQLYGRNLICRSALGRQIHILNNDDGEDVSITCVD